MFSPAVRAALNESKMTRETQKLRVRLGRGRAVNLDTDCTTQIPQLSRLVYKKDYNSLNISEEADARHVKEE